VVLHDLSHEAVDINTHLVDHPVAKDKGVDAWDDDDLLAGECDSTPMDKAETWGTR
jgi:hypothetical protein